MSRKCTVRAETKRARPRVKTSWTRTGRGRSRAVGPRLPVADQEDEQDRQAEQEVGEVGEHGDDGQDLGREEHLLDQVAAGDEDARGLRRATDWNQVQGRMPQKKKRK